MGDLDVLIQGDWPIVTSPHVLKYKKGKEDMLKDIRRQIVNIGLFLAKNDPLTAFYDKLLKAYGEIEKIHGIFVTQSSKERLQKQFPEGIPADFVPSIIPEYRATAEMILLRVQLEFGEAADTPPSADAAQQLTELTSIIDKLYDDYAALF